MCMSMHVCVCTVIMMASGCVQLCAGYRMVQGCRTMQGAGRWGAGGEGNTAPPHLKAEPRGLILRVQTKTSTFPGKAHPAPINTN